ncbi:MAG: phosphatidylserine decarboxylase [Desulfarculaceae bacterium]|jgi:phosphatidylserine decarboxylase precursor
MIGKKSLGTLLALVIVMALAVLGAGAMAAAKTTAPAAQAVETGSNIAFLKKILKDKPDIKKALLESLKKANWKNIKTLDQYYAYLERTEKLIPKARTILQEILEFYYLIDQSEYLDKSKLFQQWVVRFARDWGKFLDTPESLKNLDTFYKDKSFHMEDYYVGPSGWRTFNQFFAREIKPGKRPVAGLCDGVTIVSPADSVYQGAWKIDQKSNITVKGMKYSVKQLLDGSKYKDAFKGGVFTHSFLNVNDYHRYHVPVDGQVLETKVILGRMYLGVAKDPKTGKLEPVDDEGWQMTQARGLIVLKTKSMGLVAVLPIGMAQVSSVTITPDVGDTLAKGEEFGFFQFGGSDIITVFQAGKVKLTGKPGVHYLQGQKIGEALR